MREKILLIADIHFPTLSVDKITPTKYQNNFINNFHVNRLMLLSKEINNSTPTRVYIIGDFVDKNYINLPTLIVLKQFIENINAKVYYLNGNHEKISHNEYLLSYIADFLNIYEIPREEIIDGLSLKAIHHKDIDKLLNMKGDILFSHFRWYHSLYGAGEILREDLDKVSNSFNQLYLGDMHYQYEPKQNVHYIGQPYSSKYYRPTQHTLTLLTISDSEFTHERIPINLPNKLLHVLESLDNLQEFINGLSETDLHKIVITLQYSKEFIETDYSVPSNVEIVVRETISSEDIEVKIDNDIDIKEVLLSKVRVESRPFIESVIGDKDG